MLSDAEKLNVIDLLNTISPEDLLDIARTTTSGIISAENQHDAVRIIIQHAEDVRSLLARKKITKTILFKYLHNKRVPFAAAIDKATLIDATITFWKKGGTSNSALQTYPVSSVDDANQLAQANNFQSPEPAVSNPVSNLCDELAFKFCEWFFRKMNESLMMTGGETVVENDFWQDATAHVTLESGQEIVQHSAAGNQEIVTLLSNLQSQHNLYFSPNLSAEGLRAKAEPHGLVLIMVCGTLHHLHGQCVGIFEQKFGLIKDPFASENWKIRNLQLNLHSKADVSMQPVLPPEILSIEQ